MIIHLNTGKPIYFLLFDERKDETELTNCNSLNGMMRMLNRPYVFVKVKMMLQSAMKKI